MLCCSAHQTGAFWRGCVKGRSVRLTLWEMSLETARHVFSLDKLPTSTQDQPCCVYVNTPISSFPQIVLVNDEQGSSDQADRGHRPVDLQLEWVLGKMPQKVFKMEHLAQSLQPLALPSGLKVKDALERVLRLPAVASKRYLTNKVCVVAALQCLNMYLYRHPVIPCVFTTTPYPGGPFCDWVSCPATMRRPSSHPIG